MRHEVRGEPQRSALTEVPFEIKKGGFPALSRAEFLQRVIEAGLIPVIRGRDPEVVLEIVETLIAGGVRTVEITFTVPDADKLITTLRERYPHIMIGAGTLLNEEDARRAVVAGAHYLVGPGVIEDVARVGDQAGVPVFLGAMTPTEIARALALGSDMVKLFPGSILGPEYLKAVRAVFPGVRWCPTGGIDGTNLATWLDAGATAIGIGNPLLRDVERTRDYVALLRRTREWVALFDEARRNPR